MVPQNSRFVPSSRPACVHGLGRSIVPYRLRAAVAAGVLVAAVAGCCSDIPEGSVYSWSSRRPTGGERVDSLTPTFSWSAVGRAVRYEFALAPVSEAIEDAQVVVVSIPEYTLTEPLADGTDYAWRVRAVGCGGGRSAWSDEATFSTPVGLLGGLDPTDDEVIADTPRPTFSWNASAFAAGYHFQIAVDEAGLASADPIGTTGAVFVPSIDLPDGGYVWRVRLVDADGEAGPWSAIHHVTIGVGADAGGSSGDTDEPGDVPSFYWGFWVRMDGVNERWYFSDRVVTIGDSATVASVLTDDSLSVAGRTVVRLTDNMLYAAQPSATDDGFYLFRRSGANASIRAGLRADTAAARTVMRALGQGIDVVLRNLANAANEVESTTDADGSLAFDGVIPGDEYEMQVPVQPGVERAVSVNVVPSFDGENVGFVTVTDARQNFKVRGIVTSSDGPYIYAGRTYPLLIRITNVGTEEMLEANYSVSVPAGVTLTGASTSDILGSVAPEGGVREIAFNVTVAAFDTSYRDVDIGVEIVSKDGMNRWVDNVAMRVFREPMTIYVASQTAEVQGVVISPERSSLAFATSGRMGEVTVPLRERPYVLALSGAGYNTETKYAFRANERPTDNGSSVGDTRINEPNDDETQAVPAFLYAEHSGYLGVYDLDFYNVYGSIAEGSVVGWYNRVPVNRAAVDSATPSFSWEPVAGAVGYEIQIGGVEVDLPDETPVWVGQAATYTSTAPLTGDADGYWFWRLRASDADGNVSGWSSTYRVTVPADGGAR